MWSVCAVQQKEGIKPLVVQRQLVEFFLDLGFRRKTTLLDQETTHNCHGPSTANIKSSRAKNFFAHRSHSIFPKCKLERRKLITGNATTAEVYDSRVAV